MSASLSLENLYYFKQNRKASVVRPGGLPLGEALKQQKFWAAGHILLLAPPHPRTSPTLTMEGHRNCACACRARRALTARMQPSRMRPLSDKRFQGWHRVGQRNALQRQGHRGGPWLPGAPPPQNEGAGHPPLSCPAGIHPQWGQIFQFCRRIQNPYSTANSPTFQVLGNN